LLGDLDEVLTELAVVGALCAAPQKRRILAIAPGVGDISLTRNARCYFRLHVSRYRLIHATKYEPGCKWLKRAEGVDGPKIWFPAVKTDAVETRDEMSTAIAHPRPRAAQPKPCQPFSINQKKGLAGDG
jgi:hypothetical protein